VAESPRAVGTACGARRKVSRNAPLAKLLVACRPSFPLFPDDAPEASPDPTVEAFEHVRCLTEAEVGSPTPQVGGEVADHLAQAHGPRPSSDLPDSRLEPLESLGRYASLGLVVVGEAEAEEFALPRTGHRTFRLIDSQLELCLLYTSPSPRDRTRSRMPSSA